MAFYITSLNSIIWLIIVLCITLLISVFLKYAIRRHLFSKKYPTSNVGFFSLFGELDKSKSFILNAPTFNIGLQRACFHYIQKFKKYSLFCIWASFVPVILIAKARSFEDLMTSSKTLKKSMTYKFLHDWLGTGLLTSHGSKWKSRRKLLTYSFHFDILKEFMPVFNQQSQKLIEILHNETEKEYTNIIIPITLCALDIICETTLGVNIKAQENEDSEYVKAVIRATHVIGERTFKIWQWPNIYFWLTPAGRQFSKDLKLLHNFTRSVIKQKKYKLLNDELITFKKRKALMDLLLEHHLQTKEFTEEDIREEVDTFTFEGHDTTSQAMYFALYLIGLHKDIQEKLHQEMDRIFGGDTKRPVTKDDLNDMTYLECVLKESLRLYPPVAIIGRETEDDVTIGGYEFPKGTMCAAVIYHIHRDEDVFPDPEKFDPDRFLPENSANRHPFAYAPFSAGQRNCIGQRFAIMEEKVVISNILRNFSLDSLDSRDELMCEMKLITRPLGPLRIKIRPRRSHL